MSQTRIDDCLSDRQGRLFIEERDAAALCRDFGSPLFVVSEAQLRRNVRRFQSAFAAGWQDGPVRILPAAKASFGLAVQTILASEGCGADVYSAGELDVVLRVGVEPKLISVNGFPKDPEHVKHSVACGARITIDSVEELDYIEQAARALNTQANVRLRLKPVLSEFVDNTEFAAEGLVPTDVAALIYKGGLAFEEAVAVGQRVMRSPHLKLTGLHQHHGRHDASLRYWEAQMRAFAREIARLSQALSGYQPDELDIGGGFAIPRDPHNAMTKYGEPFELAALYGLSKVLYATSDKLRYRMLKELIGRFAEMTPNRQLAPTIEEYANTATATLKRELRSAGIRTEGVMLQLEPGRAMHGNTGIHLATVRGIKQVREPVRWEIVAVDTTEFWFTAGRYEHYLHDFCVANRLNAPADTQADVVGISCFADRLLPAVRVPRLELGDVLAFMDTGAYQEGSASNFNALPRPATVLVTGDRAEVVRRRETVEDVFARDRLPAHLAAARQAPSSAPHSAVARLSRAT